MVPTGVKPTENIISSVGGGKVDGVWVFVCVLNVLTNGNRALILFGFITCTYCESGELYE